MLGLGGAVKGVNFDATAAGPGDQQLVWPALKAAGTGWVRIGASWKALEPVKGRQDPGYLANLDRAIVNAQAAGVRILVVYVGSPAWAAPTWNTPPVDPSWYAESLSFLVQRYPQVGAWEVWNEENVQHSWSGTAAQYVSLLHAAHAVVKRYSKARVVFGGTAHTDPGWVADCYAAGVKGSFDILGVHPYPKIHTNLKVAEILGSTNSVRKVMAAHGDRSPVWFTELGWSTGSVTAAQQAHALAEAYAYIRKELGYVKAALWFEAKNQGSTATDPADLQKAGYSLILPTGLPSQAWHAYTRM